MLEAKDKRISDLEEKLSDALEQNKLGRKKRFVRSSEQARLLNNRDKDVRAEEKSDYDDGSNAPIWRRWYITFMKKAAVPARL